jgi:hypothetical protein
VTIEDILDSVVPQTNWFVVLRPFSGDNGEYQIGEVVDTTDWLHTRVLIQRRYIRALPYGTPIPDEVVGSDGIKRRILELNQQTEKPKPAKAERPTPSRK